VNEYDPAFEAQKIKINETQLKFKGSYPTDALLKLGADVLGIIEQSDEYYNPFGKDFRISKELLRIRHEGNRRVLTYKGPDQGDPVLLKRQKFGFEIDGETEELFRNFYGTNIMTIKKTRILYLMDGVIFSLDMDVTKIAGGQVEKLGDFVEVRFSPENNNPLTILCKLNLPLINGTKQAYWEM
jgi:predicted adenylyl cyclase CyaB